MCYNIAQLEGENMAKYRLTKETFGSLQLELESLENSLPGAIIAKREASQLGDLNENFEYDAAVAELDRIYARIILHCHHLNSEL